MFSLKTSECKNSRGKEGKTGILDLNVVLFGLVLTTAQGSPFYNIYNEGSQFYFEWKPGPNPDFRIDLTKSEFKTA